MAIDAGLAEILTDTWRPLGPVRVRRMFGGAGVFIGEMMIALVADGTLFVKGDETSRPTYEAAGSVPFTYERSGARPIVMSYWRAPDRLLDEPEELLVWGERALAAARRSAKPKRSLRARRG